MRRNAQATASAVDPLIRGAPAAFPTPPRSRATRDDKVRAASISANRLSHDGSRISRRTPLTLAASALLLGLLSATTGAAAGEACPPYSIGLDTTYTTGADGPTDHGEATGQVFLARDTLIRSISVWRSVPPDTNYFGMKLFITRADSTGRPNTGDILLSGPTIVIPFGDGVHPIEYKFVFDPPFALPARGHYWFGVQPAPCYGFLRFLLNNANAYEDGDAWLTGRVHPSECYLRPSPRHFPDIDLVFQIQFCDVSTPVLPTSWGALKIRYR